MPHVPLREVREAIRRRLSNDRLVSAELIVEEPDGTELVRAGGVWDGFGYIDPPPGFKHQPEIFRLQDSQVAAGRGLAQLHRGLVRGDKGLDVVVMLGGEPGSGKTVLLMAWQLLQALQWPHDVQFTSNLNMDNRGECLSALRMMGRPDWWSESEDVKDPHLAFFNGHCLKWASSRNVSKLRQRGLPLRGIGLNEAQDQSEELYAIAQTAPRRYGAPVVITMNPPTTEGGNWTARLWFGIESGEVRGLKYHMPRSGNAAVDHDYLDAAGQAVRIATPRFAAAHVDGVIGTAGPTAYPSFDGRPCNHASPADGGHVGEPPDLGWSDVTRELTASLMGGGGADVVIGCDFQKHPGCVGVVAKLYRTADRRLVLFAERVIGVPGQEDTFSQALIDAGYTGNGYRGDGSTGPRALLIGDATGDRQNSEHKRWLPPSYRALEAHGWVIKPPMYHHKNRTPWNPAVLESIDQMFVAFERREILLGPRCREVVTDFSPSLVDCLRNAQKNSFGKLRRGEVFQHPPDGLRYLAWLFLPKPQPKANPMDRSIYEAMKSLSLAAGRNE